MELRDLAAAVWRRRLLAATLVLACAALGVVFASTREAQYESRVTIAITPDIRTQGFVPSDNLSALLGTYAETVESDSVLGEAERRLGRPLDAEITSSTEAGTGILRVYARANTPEGAQEAADAVADAFVGGLADDRFIVAQVVDPASLPETAVQPRPPLIIGTSVIVGFGVALLAALALERFRRRLETPADLATITQLPLIAEIPKSRKLNRGGPQIIWDDPASTDLQEAYRTLRTNFTFAVGRWPQVVQVTSASEEQGKSTVVANLAVAFSQLGVKVAVVDADLRRPVQHEIFSLDNLHRAWTSGVRPQPEWEQQHDESLVVFPAGPPLSDPSSALYTAFPPLVQDLRRQFDLVLVDSAPLLPVADARLVAPWVDGVPLVAASGRERLASVRRAINELTLTNVAIKGFVLTQGADTEDGGYYRRPDALLAVDQDQASQATSEERGPSRTSSIRSTR